ncbi:MAG: alcohol dehydrogenase catalytic domain-containing protein [Thermodesulfobacteriota bacterium]
MRLMLTGSGQMEVMRDDNHPSSGVGEIPLKVLYCGVCRTDAKMWAQGHRDLVLPRVPGHEIVAIDGRGRRYVVWPGDSCGECDFCRGDRENLCRRLKIIGFHRDGGFADRINVPEAALIPFPETLDPLVACLAEPAGCVLHALDKCRLGAGARVLIYGGGTMGLLSALAAAACGAVPIVIEPNAAKRRAAQILLDESAAMCLAETEETEVDAVINACPDAAAFARGLTRLCCGGCFCFFSGLNADNAFPADLINHIHYREITVIGSYGLTRSDMRRAIAFLKDRQPVAGALIQAIAGPEEAPGLMPRVLAGGGFKYILNFCDL